MIIVDDHPFFRAGVRQRLTDFSAEVDVVGEASDGSEAIALVDALLPDVVLMDISMPGMNGIEATRIIKRKQPQVGILILTVYDDDQYVTALLEAGAAGYLLKTVEIEELSHAIASVFYGEAVLVSGGLEGGVGQAGSHTGPRGVAARPALRPRDGGPAAGGRRGLQQADRGLLAVSIRTVHAHIEPHSRQAGRRLAHRSCRARPAERLAGA